MISRSRRSMGWRAEVAATPAPVIRLCLVGPVHFGRGSVSVRPLHPEASMFDAHGLRSRYVPVIPKEAALRINDMNFLLLTRDGIAQRSKLHFHRAGHAHFPSHAIQAPLHWFSKLL